MSRQTITWGLVWGAVIALSSPGTLLAAEELPPVSERFADSATAETPDFQKHVVPLLGKLGCNSRSCHGSFQGRGGFQLSLFGYDFKMDHAGLLDRVDLDDPAESYALHKPTLQEPHEGGERMKVGSWEYNVFLNWIKSGAEGVGEKPAGLARLEVTPAEIWFSDAEQSQQLRAVAVWEDGHREDVTCLCRFQSNDDVICDVNSEGLVSSGEVGDSHIVVFYDNAVVPVPVLRPIGDEAGEKYPQVATSTEVDRLVVEKLRKLGILPSEVCDDATFLRRVHLDLVGTLPTAGEVRAFLSDSNPDKRSRKVDELLQTDAYAAWWTTRLCDWTGCSDQQLQNVNPANPRSGSSDWYDWIYQRVVDNVPYDQLVEGIVIASSRLPGESYREYCERMSEAFRSGEMDFGEQPGLIYFWGRRNFQKTEDRAIGFAYTFMGTRIQCAQCHKHPFDVWTQEDFQQFEQFFARVNFARNGLDRKEYQAIIEELGIGKLRGGEQRRAIQKAAEAGKTIPFPELGVQPPRLSSDMKRKIAAARKAGRDVKVPVQVAKLLGEQEVDLGTIEDPRTALMDWLRNSPTRLFAKAFVNRVWANYFHRGLVEPTDDLSLANPPSNAAVLDYLVDGFIESGYDMKWLHREICLSDTYQRSWKPNETNVLDERNFSRAVPRRLPAEVAYDALTMATANDERAEAFDSDLRNRAIRMTSPPRNNASNGPNYALSIFGRSIRESNCDCDRSSEASLLQTVYTRNDDDVFKLLDDRKSWLSQVTSDARAGAAASDDERKLDAAEKRIERLEQAIERAREKGAKGQIAGLEKQLKQLRATVRSLTKSAPPEAPKVDVPALVDEAYLRTLSRFPTDAERAVALEHVQSDESASEGLRDLVWALINTKEFLVNH